MVHITHTIYLKKCIGWSSRKVDYVQVSPKKLDKNENI